MTSCFAANDRNAIGEETCLQFFQRRRLPRENVAPPMWASGDDPTRPCRGRFRIEIYRSVHAVTLRGDSGSGRQFETSVPHESNSTGFQRALDVSARTNPCRWLAVDFRPVESASVVFGFRLLSRRAIGSTEISMVAGGGVPAAFANRFARQR